MQILTNTRLFSEAAVDWVNNGGKYIRAPKGSRDYKDYWQIQTQRCEEGYSVGGLWIPGRHYFYLNFCPILKVPDEILMKTLEERRNTKNGGRISKVAVEKILEFPRFYEIDYKWYNFKNIAWLGGKFDGVDAGLGGLHLCVGKTRDCGFSYKEASDGNYNYFFIEKSKSFYFASKEAYLIDDGILNKAKGMRDFINDNTDWKLNNQKLDTPMKWRGTFLDGKGVERGWGSEVIGQIVDDPNKVRGKRGRKITFEEAGSFKRLKDALAISVGAVKSGGYSVGQITVLGTGGEEGPSIEGLEEIHAQPHAYDMLAFPNIWDDGMESTKCGFFVPVTMADPMFMDEDGNVDLIAATRFDDVQREKKKSARDPKELDRRIAEYPRTPSEMFRRMHVNPFNVAEVDAQIRRIETDTKLRSMLRHGHIIASNGEGERMKFIPSTRNPPIVEYPHSPKSNLEGCTTIVEPPYVDASGTTPAGLYQIVFDPYYKEESESVVSLFAFYVLKIDSIIDPISADLPVAWGVCRPKELDTAYRMMFNAAEFYNCTVQGEIAGGGQGVVDYAKRNKLLHRVEYEPEMVHNKEMASNAKNRAYLMNMATERKRMGLTYFIDYHMKPRGINGDGQLIYNIQRIYDIGLLREMRKFDGKKNADRISAMIIGMFMLKERAAGIMKETIGKSDFFDKPLFGSYESYTPSPIISI